MLGLNRTQILYSAVGALYTAGPAAVYDAVEKPLQIWQTAAVFEVFFFSVLHTLHKCELLLDLFFGETRRPG
jgi:hypothetical protein